MMTVVVFGGRDFQRRRAVWRALDQLLEKHPRLTMLHGGCPTGADRSAGEWAAHRGVECRVQPAHWRDHGRSAGPRRNQVMAQQAQAAVGFPGGKGTADMARRLDRLGVPIWWPLGRQHA